MSESTITLRAPEPEDIEILYKWENDQEIWHVSNTITPFSRFVLKQYLENAHEDIYEQKQLRLMIDLYTDGQKFTIGSIDLFDFDPFHQRAGIGILIAQSFRGMGYGSASLDKLIDYVFNVLVLKQVYCNINIDNSASIDLFTKKGFKKIGTKKSWIRTSYGWKDEIMLQLINPLLKV